MIGFLCTTKAANDEEYKEVVKNKLKADVVIMLIGIITLTAGLLAEFVWEVQINDHALGVYTGFGTGLLIAGFFFLFKNLRMLKNVEVLHENRIKCADERVGEISTKAFRAASIMLLIGLYIMGLFGCLFYPVLIKILCGLISLFVLTYLISFKIYDSKM